MHQAVQMRVGHKRTRVVRMLRREIFGFSQADPEPTTSDFSAA